MIRTWPGMGLGLVLLAAAQAACAQSAAPVSRETAVATAQIKAPACSPAAIREAVDRRQAPALKGCRYDDVSATLMQFHFFPLPNRVYNGAEAGVIFDQTPTAGTAGKPSLILLQVSKGPRPETPPASSSASEASSEPVPASSSAASTSSASQTSSVAASSMSSMSSAAASTVSGASMSGTSISGTSISGASVSGAPAAGPDGSELSDSLGQLWSAVSAYPLPAVIALALAAVLAALGLKGRPRPKGGAMPRVRCDLEPGPSRLRRSGPLVLGRKGGVQ